MVRVGQEDAICDEESSWKEGSRDKRKTMSHDPTVFRRLGTLTLHAGQAPDPTTTARAVPIFPYWPSQPAWPPAHASLPCGVTPPPFRALQRMGTDWSRNLADVATALTLASDRSRPAISSLAVVRNGNLQRLLVPRRVVTIMSASAMILSSVPHAGPHGLV